MESRIVDSIKSELHSLVAELSTSRNTKPEDWPKCKFSKPRDQYEYDALCSFGQLLDEAVESRSEELLENLREEIVNLMENDPNNPFIVSEIINEDNLNELFTTPDGSNSDKSYNPSLDGPDDDSFISMKNRKINHTYD